MKKNISITIDAHLLNVINPKNLSKYFNDLLAADVVEQDKGRLTKQMESYLTQSPTFRNYLANEMKEIAHEVLSDIRSGY